MLPQIGKLQTLLLIIQSGGGGGGGASFVRAFRRGPERFEEGHEAKLRTDVALRGAIYSKKNNSQAVPGARTIMPTLSPHPSTAATATQQHLVSLKLGQREPATASLTGRRRNDGGGWRGGGGI